MAGGLVRGAGFLGPIFLSRPCLCTGRRCNLCSRHFDSEAECIGTANQGCSNTFLVTPSCKSLLSVACQYGGALPLYHDGVTCFFIPCNTKDFTDSAKPCNSQDGLLILVCAECDSKCEPLQRSSGTHNPGSHGWPEMDAHI
jgi:hypothetical protein